MKQLNFNLDPDSKIRLYFQLYTKFAEDIKAGAIPEGTKLPSVRILSQQLNISRNTVTKAYQQLEQDGYIKSEEKRGYFACLPDGSSTKTFKTLEPASTSESVPTVDSILSQFKPSILENSLSEENQAQLTEETAELITQDGAIELRHPELTAQEPQINEENNSPQQEQQSSESLQAKILETYKFVLTETPEILQKYHQPFGEEQLKKAITGFLKDFRNIDTTPDQIIISSSIQTLLHHILRLPSIVNVIDRNNAHGLLQKAEQVQEKEFIPVKPSITFVEGTCFNPEEVFSDCPISVKKITAKDNENGFNSDATLSYVSPIDVPLGYFENINDKRREMLDWADEKDYRYLIEYDASCVQSNALTFKCYDKNNKVIYLNSFSKLIASGITGAWAILPEPLITEYKAKYRNMDCPLSILDQMFLAKFITSGNLTSHLEKLSNI